VKPALTALDDYDWVRTEVRRITQEGNGAIRQRRAWRRRRDVSDVVDEAAAATVEGV
jgi:carboxylate-amine ligase